VRYKGIEKNAAQVFSLIGLTNLYLARRALMSWWAKSARCARKRAPGAEKASKNSG